MAHNRICLNGVFWRLRFGLVRSGTRGGRCIEYFGIAQKGKPTELKGGDWAGINDQAKIYFVFTGAYSPVRAFKVAISFRDCSACKPVIK